MYAIVDIAGKQFKVSKDDELLVPKVNSEVGKTLEFDRVLLISDNGKIQVGKPTIKGASVKAKVVDFSRGEKVAVFKKKRRKGYRVNRGHRQDFTNILIQGIEGTETKQAGGKKDGA